jgi:hypothetical protein
MDGGWVEVLKRCPEHRVPTICAAARFAQELLERGWRGQALLLATLGRFHADTLTEDEARAAAALGWFHLRYDLTREAGP